MHAFRSKAQVRLHRTLTAVVVTLSAAFTSQLEAENRVPLGVSITLTGGPSTYGKDILSGLQFANDEFFKGRYKLMVEDDGCSATQALGIARKFTTVHKARAVLGFACSTAILASAPVYEHAKVIAISAGAAAPEVGRSGEYIFRTFPNSDRGTDPLVRYIADHHKTAGVISELTNYAQAVAAGLAEIRAPQQVRFLRENFLPGTSDFRPILERLRTGAADALILNPQSEDRLILMVQQLHEMGWKVPLYGFIHPSSPTFLSAVKELAEGFVFVDTPSFQELGGPQGDELYRRFVKRYGAPHASEYAVLAAMMSLEAIDQAIASGRDPVEFLNSEKIRGTLFDFSFDQNGEIQEVGYKLKCIRDGKVQPLETEKPQ
jgi:ABC-type branched-subunit amino acid transport system substrate-binding protein